jgi:hypothetical protein
MTSKKQKGNEIQSERDRGQMAKNIGQKIKLLLLKTSPKT